MSVYHELGTGSRAGNRQTRRKEVPIFMKLTVREREKTGKIIRKMCSVSHNMNCNEGQSNVKRMGSTRDRWSGNMDPSHPPSLHSSTKRS